MRLPYRVASLVAPTWPVYAAGLDEGGHRRNHQDRQDRRADPHAVSVESNPLERQEE